MRFLGRIFLIAAFLLAQTSAMAHQLWHFGPLVAHASGADAGKQGAAPKKDPLCAFHAALGTVLGVLSGNLPAAFLADLPDTQVDAAAVSAAIVRPLPPTSRGPPTLL